MATYRVVAVLALAAGAWTASCSGESDRTSAATQLATGSAGTGSSAGSGVGAEVLEANCTELISGIGSGTYLPGCAAGISRESGPGVPADFYGTIEDTMALSPEEQAAVAAARQLAASRAPADEDPVNLGFPAGKAVSP